MTDGKKTVVITSNDIGKMVTITINGNLSALFIESRRN